jgi:hypothetical protein
MISYTIPPWEDPKICRGCNQTDCDGDYLKCTNDALEQAGEEAFERMRDEG